MLVNKTKPNWLLLNQMNLTTHAILQHVSVHILTYKLECHLEINRSAGNVKHQCKKNKDQSWKKSPAASSAYLYLTSLFSLSAA